MIEYFLTPVLAEERRIQLQLLAFLSVVQSCLYYIVKLAIQGNRSYLGYFKTYRRLSTFSADRTQDPEEAAPRDYPKSLEHILGTELPSSVMHRQ